MTTARCPDCGARGVDYCERQTCTWATGCADDRSDLGHAIASLSREDVLKAMRKDTAAYLARIARARAEARRKGLPMHSSVQD